MNKLSKILGINLLIICIFSLSTLIEPEAGLLVFALAAVQALTCFVLSIISFIKNKPKEGGMYLLSIIVVLLIGFSVCTYSFRGTTFH